MKKLLTLFFFSVVSQIVLSKEIICTEENSFSGTDLFGPLKMEDKSQFSYLSEKKYLDFENKTYGSGDSGKPLKISLLTNIGDEIGGTIKNGTGNGLFQIHYNKTSKKLVITSNTVYKHRETVGVEFNLYQCE